MNLKFDLIQRGKFRDDGKCLTGSNGVVNLDYMGSAEFEFGAIPSSFRRIMYDYKNYIYVPTGIHTKENNELILFVNKEVANQVLEALIYFINNPYWLKEYSELEKIPNSSVKDAFYKKLDTNFWWCIDNGIDWMAFFETERKLFEKGINNDYYDWWLKKSEAVREKEYVRALRR